jgi:hypothetical protein
MRPFGRIHVTECGDVPATDVTKVFDASYIGPTGTGVPSF